MKIRDGSYRGHVVTVRIARKIAGLGARDGALLCIFIVTLVWAPVSGAALLNSEAASYSLKIDGQPLASALQDLAKQSQVQIIFFSQVAEGVQAPALKGEYTVNAALGILLSGTKLTFRVINSRPSRFGR